MKSLFCLASFLGFSTLLSCTSSQMVDGNAGNSTYYIDNQTGKDLSMTFPIQVYRAGGEVKEIDSTIALYRNTRLRFYEDLGYWGANPHPEMALKFIRFYTQENNGRKLVYTMEPVKTTYWTKNIISRDKDGIGTTDYIFVLTPDHLK